MGFSLEALRPADYAVLCVIGASIAVCLVGCLFAIPWERLSKKSSGQQASSRCWPARLLLQLLVILWMCSQVLRLSTVFGYKSVVFDDEVTDWSGRGYMCRIYLTVALGVLHPLCAVFALYTFRAMTAGSVNSATRSKEETSLTGILLLKSALIMLPVAAGQSVMAWLSTFVEGPDDDPIEKSPRSLLGYFFATYTYGTRAQCNCASDCTLCTFPAGPVILHVIWRAAFLLALWVAASKAAKAAQGSSRRVRVFQCLLTLLVAVECAVAGASIAFLPFTWPAQILWLVFFGCITGQAGLLVWLATGSMHDKAVSKRMLIWNNMDSFPNTPASNLIRAAHGESLEPSPFGPRIPSSSRYDTDSVVVRPAQSNQSSPSPARRRQFASLDSMRSMASSFAHEPPARARSRRLL